MGSSGVCCTVPEVAGSGGAVCVSRHGREGEEASPCSCGPFFPLEICSDSALNMLDDGVLCLKMNHFSRIHLNRDCKFNP